MLDCWWFKCEDLEVGVDLDPEPRLADNGDRERDLQALLEAAKAAATALALFIVELQYVAEEELATLITSLHRLAQRKLPVILIGAGPPQLPGRMGKAKSYAERLFDFPVIGPLRPEAARLALEKPAVDEGIQYGAALERIIKETQGYADFLQEWSKHVWDVAESSPIRGRDAEVASASAVSALDASFFRVRYHRLTPAEKRYLRAMADLGPGPHRSGDIAEQLGREVTALAPMRSQIISKGII